MRGAAFDSATNENKNERKKKMKLIGTNSVVTLTEQKARYWIEHQANQRTVIIRHVNGLAKLLARVGWRNDQRICLTEDGRIINGLQRISAIVKLGDYGWKIPVTTFTRQEITTDLIESFNVQKSDGLQNLMRREYNWTDKRIASICTSIWNLFEIRQNITTKDALAIYEGMKKSFDIVLSVSEHKKRGANNIPSVVNAAAILCDMDGIPIEKFIRIANEYTNDNCSSQFWKVLKDWNLEWRKIKSNEIGNGSTHIIVRYHALREFLLGKRITAIKNINQDTISSDGLHLREMLRSNVGF